MNAAATMEQIRTLLTGATGNVQAAKAALNICVKCRRNKIGTSPLARSARLCPKCCEECTGVRQS